MPRIHHLFMIAALACIGLSGCMESPAEQSPDESYGVSESPLQSGSGICCIDYTCPTNPDIEFTGCKAGGTGPGGAFRACANACGQLCHAGEWTCL